jgi:hypothetical protein
MDMKKPETKRSRWGGTFRLVVGAYRIAPTALQTISLNVLLTWSRN